MPNILEIAKSQKYVLWCVLLNIAIMVLRQPVLFLAAIPVQLYFVYRLARAVGKSKGMVWVWMVGMLIPLVSLILLLLLFQQATKAIRAAGFKVGLMGADIREIEIQANATTPPPATPDQN